MFGISWKRYNTTCDNCEIGKYLLKRKWLKGSSIIYEIWHCGQLKYTTSIYIDFLKMAQPIIKNDGSVSDQGST